MNQIYRNRDHFYIFGGNIHIDYKGTEVKHIIQTLEQSESVGKQIIIYKTSISIKNYI